MMGQTASKPPQSHDISTDTYLLFDLGGQGFAISVSWVREIRNPELAARMPDAPDLIEGLVDVRGRTIPVYDLGRRLGIAVEEDGPDHRLVVLEIEAAGTAQLIAFRTQRVRDVTLIPRTDIEPPPSFVGYAGGETVLKGVARMPQGSVQILNEATLFGAVLTVQQNIERL